MNETISLKADELTLDQILDELAADIGESAPEHLRALARFAPSSLRGHYRMWQELMRDPKNGGALPKRYKALIAIALANAAGNRDAAVFWSRLAVRWGLRMEELREAVGFFITGTGMSRFIQIGQHILEAGEQQASRLKEPPAVEPVAEFQTPAAWHSKALPTGDLPLAERPAQLPPGDEKQAAIHRYFENSFRAPMPEFWAHLGRESTGILEGYYLLRRDTFRRPSEGGHTPKKVKELMAVAIDTVLNNPWGGEAHLRAAMVDGATVADVREIEGMVIMEVGMVAYKMAGFDFLVKAEEIAAELASA